MPDILALHRQLLEAAMPVPVEQRSAEILAEWIRPYVDTVYTDNIGNLLCHKKGGGMKLVFPAHRDVIGFMARKITPSGAVKLLPVGEHGAPGPVNTPIRFENGVRGVIRKSCAERKGACGFGELYADIGAVSAAEAERLVQPGDIAAFDLPCTQKGSRVMAPYADNLAGCITLLMAARQLEACVHDVYFIFTVRKEQGAAGAQVAAWNLDPDICIAVDVSDAPDEPRGEQPRNIRLGGGPSVTVRDDCIHSPAVCEKLLDLAGELGLAHQLKAMPSYVGTDAGSFQDNRKGAVTAAINIPARGTHSPVEIYDTTDVEGAAALIAAICASEFPVIPPDRRK
jgi:endoglucanase